MSPRVTTVDSTYNARHLLVLEGLDAVRKRPGMYIGSTDTRGVMRCVWEIIDNGVDEALAGHCHEIVVTLHPDRSIEVQRRRARDPRRHGAQDRAPGRRGDLHQAARRGQVRWRLLRRHRWPARRGRLGRQRALGATRRGGRPQSVDPGDVVSSRRAGRVRRGRPRGRVHSRVRAHHPRSGAQGRHRYPHSVLARPADLHQGRPASPGTSWSPGPARRPSSCRDWRSGSATTEVPSASRRASAMTAASRSSATSWRLTPRSPASSGWRAPEPSPRRCRCSTMPAT